MTTEDRRPGRDDEAEERSREAVRKDRNPSDYTVDKETGSGPPSGGPGEND